MGHEAPKGYGSLAFLPHNSRHHSISKEKTMPLLLRKKVQSTILSALVVVAGVVATPSAKADSYSFSWSGNGISTSGIITVAPTTTAGAYQITGISGTFSDTNAGFSGAITGLEPAPLPTRTDGSTFFSAPAFTDAGFSHDNLLYPDGESPAVCIDAPEFSGGVFDIYGVAFDVAGGYTVDLWSQGALGGDMVGDSFDGVKLGNSAPGIAVTGGISPVPEPGSLMLLGTGLLGFTGSLVRKLKA
jgi:hypothetical protein